MDPRLELELELELELVELELKLDPEFEFPPTLEELVLEVLLPPVEFVALFDPYPPFPIGVELFELPP